MPFANPDERRAYMREYHAEFRVGLRRRGSAGETVAQMDERRREREEYLRAWAAANREKRSAQRRKRRREERAAAEAAALQHLKTKP